MGYFSNLDMCNNKDTSYYGHADQCEVRIEELYERLSELVASGAPYRNGESLCEADYRYALPSRFSAIYDVERAIEATCERREAYLGECDQREPYADGYMPYGDARGEVHPNQMSLFEVVMLSPMSRRAA